MKRRLTLAALCLAACAIAAGAFVLSRPRPAPVEPPDTLRSFDGEAWVAFEPDDHLVLLIHGLDEPGDIWDELAPALHDAGAAVARFDYPNDQPIADSATLFQQTLAAMRELDVAEIDVVAHSMGGLVLRDAVTRPADRSKDDDARTLVDHVITVGTPYAGSSWARFRVVGEIREHALRAGAGETIIHPSGDAEYQNDGKGEAGVDLMPGSPILIELAARPTREPVTVIVGRVSNPDSHWATNVAGQPWVRALLGASHDQAMAELTGAFDQLGDGVVSVESALALNAEDTVHLEASHRGMLRTLPLVVRTFSGEHSPVPPAIPIILDRLGLDPEAEPTP